MASVWKEGKEFGSSGSSFSQQWSLITARGVVGRLQLRLSVLVKHLVLRASLLLILVQSAFVGHGRKAGLVSLAWLVFPLLLFPCLPFVTLVAVLWSLFVVLRGLKRKVSSLEQAMEQHQTVKTEGLDEDLLVAMAMSRTHPTGREVKAKPPKSGRLDGPSHTRKRLKAGQRA